ncbi:MAG: class I SAM-dependent methyltransferase [Ignavibacteriae bacterium]|nr:class I SAM-dependent methyltransferase [Ignavibacteriota bacterium]
MPERVYNEQKEDQELLAQHIARYNFAKSYVFEKNVVDIACGSGYGCSILADGSPKKITGIDISPDAIEYARRSCSNSLVEFIVGSIDVLAEVRDVNLIVSFETIEHIKDYNGFLKTCCSVLNEKGMLIISTPLRKNGSLEDVPSNPFHVREWNDSEFTQMLYGHFRQLEIFYQYMYKKKWYPGSRTISKQQAKYFFSRGAVQMKNYEVLSSPPNLGNIEIESAYIIAICHNQHRI